MKKHKFKVIYGTKFCTKCGQKNVVHLESDWDGDTGLQEASLICINNSCDWGRKNALGCIDGHDYRRPWLFGTAICTRCGKHDYDWGM